MLVCVVVQGISTPASLLGILDFVNDTYSWDGLSYSREEVIDQPEQVMEVGLQVPFSVVISVLIPELIQFLTNEDFTVVVRWIQQSGYGVPFEIRNGPTPYPDFFVEDNLTDDRIRLWDALNGLSDRFIDVEPHPAANYHAMALTRTDARMAMSLDGAAVVANETNLASIQGLADQVSFGGTCIIQSVEIRTNASDDVLPGLATPLSPAMANDNFSDAISVSVDDLITGHLFGATAEPGEPVYPGFPGSSSVWYTFTAPSTSDFLIDASGGDIVVDALLVSVFTGTEVDDLTTVALNETEPYDQVTFSATMGTVYHISIDVTDEGIQAAFQFIITAA